MIKIPTYKEHKKGTTILERYIYIMALILPFSAADVIGKDKLSVNGKVISASNFMTEAKKVPRRRTRNYQKILKAYAITETKANETMRLANDALLAAKIIWKSSISLYQYLYDVKNPYACPRTTPRMKRDNLRTLLTCKMDELPNKLKKIGEVNSDDLLNYVFCYDRFSEKDETLDLLMDMDVPVCPYCNRLYTFTSRGKKGATRPQFDHYLPKSKYPYYAVSILNLIPSCGLCNQSKNAEDDKRVLYPYSEEFGDDVVFHTESKKKKGKFDYLIGDLDAKNDFEVVLKPSRKISGTEFEKRVNNSIDIFHLQELYNGHKDYILHLFWIEQIFTETYMDSLSKSFPTIFPTAEDVKNWIYLMETDKEYWGKRSLSKLTHDIDAES